MSEIGAGRPVWPGDSGPGDRTGDVGREAVLAQAFVRLADTLASEFDIVDFLHGLAEDSVEILRAAAAGVMLVDARGGLRLIASSDERMRLLELFEIQGAQGPCLDAFSSGRAVQANAAGSRARWPVFAPQASGAGFQVMCAVPLRVRTDVIGALNLFRGSDEPFTGAEMEIAQAMAEMAAIGLIQERALRERNLLAAQLQAALNSRVIIEQAKGCSPRPDRHGHAFRLLGQRDRTGTMSGELAGGAAARDPSWPGMAGCSAESVMGGRRGAGGSQLSGVARAGLPATAAGARRSAARRVQPSRLPAALRRAGARGQSRGRRTP